MLANVGVTSPEEAGYTPNPLYYKEDTYATRHVYTFQVNSENIVVKWYHHLPNMLDSHWGIEIETETCRIDRRLKTYEECERLFLDAQEEHPELQAVPPLILKHANVANKYNKIVRIE